MGQNAARQHAARVDRRAQPPAPRPAVSIRLGTPRPFCSATPASNVAHVVLAREQEQVAHLLQVDLPAGAAAEVLERRQAALGQPHVQLVRELRAHAAGGLAGRAAAQLAALDQHRVGHAGLGQVEQDARAHHAAADHHDVGGAGQRCSSAWPLTLGCRVVPTGWTGAGRARSKQLGVRLVLRAARACTTCPPGRRCASRSIRLVGVRHEQTAVYAADGHARVTGELGVALTTTGPGAANALGATGEAWASGSPVLVIATDIPTTLRRPGVYRGVLHETRDQARHVRAGGQGDDARGRGGRDRRRRWRGAAATALAAPSRPGLPGDPDRPARAPSASSRRLAVARATARRIDGSDWTRPSSCAPPPSGRCCGSGGGAKDAREGVAALATRARARR